MRVKHILRTNNGSFKIYKSMEDMIPIATEMSSEKELRKLRNKKVHSFAAAYDKENGCYIDIQLV